MKNFHWGHAILIFFICYIATLAFIMFKTTQVDHDLVVEDYYAKDLSYQEQYDKIENAQIDKKKINVNWDSALKSFVLIFNSKASRSGTVTLYNPMDKYKDQTFPFSMENLDTVTIININLSVGRWKVKTDWEENEKLYFLENELYIPGS